jgi:hypothetical protein
MQASGAGDAANAFDQLGVLPSRSPLDVALLGQNMPDGTGIEPPIRITGSPPAIRADARDSAQRSTD